MPPKKKEEKSDFNECAKCSILLLPKDKEKHEAQCNDSWTPGLDAEYDFIFDHIIHGTVRELQTKDSDLNDLSMNVQQQLIFLYPGTMKLCGIDVNSFVEINTPAGHSSLKIAWPHSGSSITAVCPLLPSRDLPPNSRIQVRKYADSVPEAHRVELQLISGETQEESSLLEAFRRKFFQTCLQSLSEVFCTHYCGVFKFIIKSISADENLEESLADLSLHGNRNRYFRITHNTQLNLVKIPLSTGNNANSFSYESIGGLDSQKTVLQGLTRIEESTMKTIRQFGKLPPRRILITGPTGTGKSCLVNAVATDLNVDLIEVTTQNFDELLGTSESISTLSKKALGKLIVIDNLEQVGGKKDKDGKLLKFLTSLRPEALVLATSNKPGSIDEVIRGHFDREVETTVPTSEERLDILTKNLKGMPHRLNEVQLNELCATLHGYTGANVESLVKEALANSVIRSGTIDLSYEDFKLAYKVVKPTAMREVVLEIPKVYWNDIGGMDDVKKRLRQCVEWPLLHKEAFKRLGVKPPCGLLMYGPPGCSKTMIARALATESKLNFLAVKGPELFSKWVGDSERAVRDLFRRARSVAPAVVFFDEIDAIATERKSSSGGNGVGDRVLTQLLTEIDGVESLEDVILIAATNRPDIIDEALLRPGRLDCVVYVPLPDDQTRLEILKITLGKRKVDDDVNIEELVRETNGYSGAEIVAVAQEAAMQALEESFDIPGVSKRHFTKALEIVRPRISKDSITFYERFHQDFNKR